MHTPASAISGQPSVSNLWRTTGDISNTFESMLDKITQNDGYANISGPGAWNDPVRAHLASHMQSAVAHLPTLFRVPASKDMLEVGNFWGPLGDAEGRAQFSLWCVAKAPLLIGTDLTNASAATMSAPALQISRQNHTPSDGAQHRRRVSVTGPR